MQRRVALATRKTQIGDPGPYVRVRVIQRLSATNGVNVPKDPMLIPLMREVADFTRSECARCPQPHSCCEEMYCEIARYYAKEYWNVDLQETGHATLPFMGEEGCVVAPHLRPICTMHACRIHREGTSGDPEWDRKYLEMKNLVELLESSPG